MMKRKQGITGRWRNNRGFTLIEIIAVLIIIAIVSAVAISRGTGTDEAQLRAEVDTLKGHLRYAQYLALNDISPNKWGINVLGTSYTLVKFDGTNTTNSYHLPNESSWTHNFSGGITASVTAGSSPIYFDEWGRPGTATVVATAATSVNINGQLINITEYTGFMP